MSTSGRTQTPTFINLPPSPSDPVTPSDAPGTPNSTTTSMSELSTVAIKDGHRGHLPHNHSGGPMDAERADRISRLAGLDRVGHQRTLTPTGQLGGGSVSSQQHPLAHAYFDQNNVPHVTRERSTVGSASATGSVGGRTTWASGSDVYDPDKMSEDMDVDTTSSVGGFSDEAGSLVGFGEGARTPARNMNMSPSTPNKSLAQTPTGVRHATGSTTPQSALEAQKQEARALNGMTYDPDVVDTSMRTPPSAEDGSGHNAGTY